MIAIGVVILVVAGLLIFSRDSDDTAQNSSASNSENSNSPINASDLPLTRGSYTNYQSSAVASDPGTKILFFHSSSCSQCNQLDSEIKVNQIPEGITIYKVDYDSNQSLRQKYGVTTQATFIEIDDNGNLVKRYIGYDDPTFSALSKNVF